tara:strand:+ start:3721 stop:4254 length:534 start_codon:yes stop_codon:yes gene_type:complete
MTSIIKVNTIQDVGGNNLLISNGSGSITTNNIGGQNTPAFEAYPSSDLSVASGSTVKVVANTERFDIGSCYDNSSNYRFTPNVAGRYFCYCSYTYNLTDGNLGLVAELRKNGSAVLSAKHPAHANQNYLTGVCHGVIEFNGSSDYLEFFTATDSGSTRTLASDSQRTYFGAYRIIGA